MATNPTAAPEGHTRVCTAGIAACRLDALAASASTDELAGETAGAEGGIAAVSSKTPATAIATRAAVRLSVNLLKSRAALVDEFSSFAE